MATKQTPAGDTPEPVEAVALSQLGSTFAERAKARQAAARKRIGEAENKRVSATGTSAKGEPATK